MAGPAKEWKDGSVGAPTTPVYAADLNRFEQTFATLLTMVEEGRLSGTALDAIFLPRWKPNTVYAFGALALLPTGLIGTRIQAGNSGAAGYDSVEASKWSTSSGTGSDSRLVTAGSAAPDFYVKYNDGPAFLEATEADGITSKITHRADSIPKTALAPTLRAAIDSPKDTRFVETAASGLHVMDEDGVAIADFDAARGLYSKITHLPQSVPESAFAVTRMVTLPDESGWDWVFMGTDGRAIAGKRLDGTTYGLESAAVLDPIAVFGDSLAAAFGNYLAGSTAFAAATKRSVTPVGIGGQTSTQAVARQGGKPAQLTVANNVIPASGPVSVTAYNVNILRLSADGNASITGILAGVPGVLSVVQTGSTTAWAYTFTRSAPGIATPCPAGSPFQTGFQYAKHYPIMVMGRNNLSDTATVVSDVQAALAFAPRSDRALVLGILPFESDTTATQAAIVTTNNAMRDAFGPSFIDWGAYLRSEAVLQSVGITPTPTDTANIAALLTPQSFRSDGGHLNAKGYEAVANLVIAHYAARGWNT